MKTSLIFATPADDVVDISVTDFFNGVVVMRQNTVFLVVRCRVVDNVVEREPVLNGLAQYIRNTHVSVLNVKLRIDSPTFLYVSTMSSDDGYGRAIPFETSSTAEPATSCANCFHYLNTKVSGCKILLTFDFPTPTAAGSCFASRKFLTIPRVISCTFWRRPLKLTMPSITSAIGKQKPNMSS